MDNRSEDPSNVSPPVYAAAANVPEIATEPAPLELDSVRCPKCDSELRKITVARGGKINCLQCGARFSPPAAAFEHGAPSTESGAAATPEKVLPGREPKSPAYWLLRIPAILGLIAGVIFTIAMAVAFWRNFNYFYAMTATRQFEELLVYSYVPLAFSGGFLALAWTQSLARIDTGLMHKAWKAGVVREPLPAPQGSSLPYIAPLGLVGGLMPVLALMLNPNEKDSVIFAALFGAVVFYFGFASEDLRQFFWRQQKLGAKYMNFKWGGQNPSGLGTRAFAAAFGCLALVFGWIALNSMEHSYQSSELLIAGFGFAICAALGVTAVVILRLWESAVETWAMAAASARHPGGFGSTVYPRWIAWMIRIPYIWAAYGAVYMACLCFSNDGPSSREIIPVCLSLLSGLALCVGFSALMWTVARWSASISWIFGADQKTPSKPGFSARLVRYTILYSLCQALALSFYFIQEFTRWGFRWQQVMVIPLLVGMIHYPTLWIATVAAEFLKVERQLSTTTVDADS